MPKARSCLPAIILVFMVCITVGAQQPKIYWADEVPKGWNGKWQAKFLTIPEKTDYARTTSTLDLQEFVDTLKWNSENIGVINVFTSALRKVAPAIVLANPRITSPQEAVRSGKPVIFIEGNIHPAEPEGTEAILMAMREILFGSHKQLLDNQIVIFLPIFNVDGFGNVNSRWSIFRAGHYREIQEPMWRVLDEGGLWSSLLRWMLWWPGVARIRHTTPLTTLSPSWPLR